MDHMKYVCCIVNFEGFIINRKFLVREFAWVNVTSGQKGSVRFDLRPFNQGLDEKARKTIYFSENKIHGLRFSPNEGEQVSDLKLLNEKIQEVYDSCKTSDKILMAYKGGGGSKNDILMKLKIPEINMEEFGCPKYHELQKYHTTDSCGYHKNNLPCSASKVDAFQGWLLDSIRTFKD